MGPIIFALSRRVKARRESSDCVFVMKETGINISRQPVQIQPLQDICHQKTREGGKMNRTLLYRRDFISENWI